MQFRMGIHMGDVMADEDEVFGDDVNIAVRLESVAAPGGVAVSGKACHEAGKRLSVALADAGPHRFKNIEEPIQVWTWQPAGSDASGRGAQSLDRNVGHQPSGPVSHRDRGRAAVCESERKRRRVFFRRADRGPDPRAVAAIVLPGAEPQLDLLVQGQEPEHAPDRARDRRELPDPGLGAARRRPRSASPPN